MHKLISCVFVLLLFVSPAWASHIFSVPDRQPEGTPWPLLPNTPGQEVKVYATGGEQVAGLNFTVSVGDGGVDAGGVDVGPKITAISLVGSGMVFPTGSHANTLTSSTNVPGSGTIINAPLVIVG